MENIAKIKLSPGKVGFYDHLSNIHLTLGSPTAYVPSGTNCAALRRNLKAGLIELLEGTLGEDIAPFKVEKMENGNFRIVSNEKEVNKPIYRATSGDSSKEDPRNNIYIDEREKNGPGEGNKDHINKEPPMKVTSEEINNARPVKIAPEEAEEEVDESEEKSKRKRATKKKD